MMEQTRFETIKVEGGKVMERIVQLIHEGNVRRIVIRQDEAIVAEFPLTVGVVGAVIAPIAAAIGALAALLSNCRIEIERVASEAEPVEAPKADEALEVVI